MHKSILVNLKVQGLCGVYNLNHKDDFTLPSGAITIDAAEFGNAWKTNVACQQDTATTGVSVDACTLSSRYASEAKVTCSGLKRGEFDKGKLKDWCKGIKQIFFKWRGVLLPIVFPFMAVISWEIGKIIILHMGYNIELLLRRK